MFKSVRKIHFVGIGGSGMSGIAEVLINLGYQVSGSDAKASDVTERLVRLGAAVVIGHQASNVGEADVVVISTAIQPDNVEVQAARKKKIPVIPRIEMLAELARLKYAVTIAGTHGKTTTTSMTAMILQEGELDPTIVIGGKLRNLESGAKLGKGDYLVAEADESDGSFLKLASTIAVVTNIDDDHLDYHKTMEKLEEAFLSYINRVPFYGAAILCVDDERVRALLPRVTRRQVTYGFSEDADLKIENFQADSGHVSFGLRRKGQVLGMVRLLVPGRHNALNATAAIAVGLELGISFERMLKALEEFGGVARRIEVKGEARGILVVDDYGHHPTEIEATLVAIQQNWPKRRYVVLFQPHRYSRTQLLAARFAKAFDLADSVWLTPIYAAGEKPLAGVSSDLILNPLKKSGKTAALFQPGDSNDLQRLKSYLQSGDVVITPGAGDIWKTGVLLLEMLHKQDLSVR